MFWIVFVGLKLAELAVIVFVPWLLGCWLFEKEDGVFAQWGMGLMVMLAAGAVLGLLLILGYALVEANFEWAKSIAGAV